MSHTPTCFLCADQVLGLRGQDVTLDTFYLCNQDEDQKALANDAFGECHLRCLINSKWGGFWARRIAGNLRDVRQFECLLENEELQVLRNVRLAETIVVRSDGWFTFLPDLRLREARKTPEGLLLPVTEEMSVMLSGHSELIAEIEQELEAKRAVSLWDLTNRLGLSEHLLYPEAIRPGEVNLLQGTGARNKPLRCGEGEILLFAVFTYDEFIPGDVAEPVLQLRHSGRY
jgi:hypothetical protein